MLFVNSLHFLVLQYIFVFTLYSGGWGYAPRYQDLRNQILNAVPGATVSGKVGNTRKHHLNLCVIYCKWLYSIQSFIQGEGGGGHPTTANPLPLSILLTVTTDYTWYYEFFHFLLVSDIHISAIHVHVYHKGSVFHLTASYLIIFYVYHMIIKSCDYTKYTSRDQ